MRTKNLKPEKEIWFKQKTKPRMSYEWIGINIEKKPIQKNKRTVKFKMKLLHVNKKQLARKRIFVQTPFSHSNLRHK